MLFSLKFIDLAGAKGKSLIILIVCSKKIWNRVMLSGEGNVRERWKTPIGLIRKKATLHVQHPVFVHFFAVVLHDYNVKLPGTSFFNSYTFYGGNVVRVIVHLFFTAAHFHHALVASSTCHCLTTATKFSCCSPNQKMSPLFFISRSRSLSPFFSMSFAAGLPPTFSFSRQNNLELHLACHFCTHVKWVI